MNLTDLNLSEIHLIEIHYHFPAVPWNQIITVLVLVIFLVGILKGWIPVKWFK